MQTGKLDQRIVLQELTETNNFGELVQTYTTVATVWADVISQRGAESFEAARINAVETIRVKIRYRDDIMTDWRIQWNGKNYNVIYLDQSERRKGETWMTCEVVGA